MNKKVRIAVGSKGQDHPEIIDKFLVQLAVRYQMSKAAMVAALITQAHGATFPERAISLDIKPPVGCYLGWEGCTNTADIQVGNGWMCGNCYDATQDN